MNKKILLSVFALCMLGSTAANAGVYVGINTPAPVYAVPAPVYAAPVYAPPPIMYAPSPYYYGTVVETWDPGHRIAIQRYWNERHRWEHEHPGHHWEREHHEEHWDHDRHDNGHHADHR
jgi:hypothetical protein